MEVYLNKIKKHLNKMFVLSCQGQLNAESFNIIVSSVTKRAYAQLMCNGIK